MISSRGILNYGLKPINWLRMDLFNLPTWLDLTQGHFNEGSHAQIGTHAWPSEKMLGFLGIPFLVYLRCKVTNSALQNRYCIGEIPWDQVSNGISPPPPVRTCLVIPGMLGKHNMFDYGGVLDAMVTVVGNGRGDPSSNSVQGCWHLT